MDGSPLETPGAGGMPRPPATAAGDEEDALLGQTLDGRYQVLTRIGVGGMGVVYRGTHALIGKEVAIKVLRRAHVEHPDVLERFLQEARLASSIRHPNVVEISDYGQLSGGGAYYVMEFLQGRSLAEQIDHGGRIDPRRAIGIAAQVARGLGAAHGRGIVHRDLKPDNVFLTGARQEECEHVKILDFGIARVVGRKTRITKIGAVVGTPEYMSPEQARGADVDHRTDLYALGVITFEMLTGKVPFRGDTLLGTLTKQMFDAPPALRQIDPNLPDLRRCESAVNRLMAKSRDERPGHAEDAIRLLQEAVDADLGGGGRDQPAKRTVAMGSDSIEAHRPPVGSGVVARGDAPGWPQARTGDAAGQPPRASPSVIIREGTPAEFLSPAQSRRRRGQARMHGSELPPIPLMMLGAAIFAGAVTFGLVRRLNPGLEEPSNAGSVAAPPATTRPAAAKPPAISPRQPAMLPPMLPPTPAPGAATAAPTSTDTPPVAEQNEGSSSGQAAPSSKKRAQPGSRRRRPRKSAPANAPPPVQKPTRDPPDPGDRSIGDLKDPFSRN